jgi:hypothetical protein
MRFAKLLSFVIGLLGAAVIAILVMVIANMGGGGFLWVFIALLLLVLAAVHLVPAGGLVMPWVLGRLPPDARWAAFFGWLVTALPILLFDVVLLVGRIAKP